MKEFDWKSMFNILGIVICAFAALWFISMTGEELDEPRKERYEMYIELEEQLNTLYKYNEELTEILYSGEYTGKRILSAMEDPVIYSSSAIERMGEIITELIEDY